ncbi:MAG: glycosyltransferase family 2 protein [Bacteroidales bacterium]|nr:glycosyltransferase family 2 protein [Candidatus Colimorpha onthohippi]
MLKCNCMNYCVIIPTYNNENTLVEVVNRSLSQCDHVIVVNDGSTDGTEELLLNLQGRIDVISYMPNRGKGYALKKGLRYALKKGFDYAVSIDSDGQHYPEEICMLVAEAQRHQSEKVLIVGSRNLESVGMPRKNTIANKFSNFWFMVQTGHCLGDTQTGFRLYQLNALPCIKWITNKYEAEIELLVLSAWLGVNITSVPISVNYEPQGDRVSHFRPFADFFRIFIVNTVLCFMAIIYGYPSAIIRRHFKI